MRSERQKFVSVALPEDFNQTPEDVLLDFGSVRPNETRSLEVHVHCARTQRLALELSVLPPRVRCLNGMTPKDSKGRAWWVTKPNHPAIVQVRWNPSDVDTRLQGRLLFRLDDKRTVLARLQGTVDYSAYLSTSSNSLGDGQMGLGRMRRGPTRSFENVNDGYEELDDSTRKRRGKGGIQSKGSLGQMAAPVVAKGINIALPATARFRPIPGEKNIMEFLNQSRMSMDKQEKAYTEWLNFVLAPSPIFCEQEGELSAEEALTSRSILAKVRGLLNRVFRHDRMLTGGMRKVNLHIDEGHIKILREGSLLTDIGMRRRAFESLTKYHPFWLRLGAETVIGKPILGVHQGLDLVGDAWLKNLPGFIEDEFLSDRELEAQRAANHIAHDKYMGELGNIVLKRFLLLVFLLDRTMSLSFSTSIPDGAPLLFCVDSKSIKSSEDMIRNFLQGSIVGEGNTIRQLETMGFRLSYVQKEYQEFEYRVGSVRTDLRCGLRIGKLMGVLTGDTSLLSRMCFTVNTIRQHLKPRNNKMVLEYLEERDKRLVTVNGTRVEPRHLISGCREMTLGLMWNIIEFVQMPMLLTRITLQYEIIRIKSRRRSEGGEIDEKKGIKTSKYPSGGHVALLLEWVQSVAWIYGVQVQNFTSDFCDGGVLCLLVHYYRPSHINLDDIFFSKAFAGSDSSSDVFGDGIRRNFRAVLSAMQTLGGVPETVSPTDYQHNGPHEEGMVIFVSFLCARLIDVSKEERAAIMIQRSWRNYVNPSQANSMPTLAVWVKAAKVIQKQVRLFLIQRRYERRKGAAVLIQSCWHGRNIRREFLNKKRACILIQAAWRGYHIRAIMFRLSKGGAPQWIRPGCGTSTDNSPVWGNGDRVEAHWPDECFQEQMHASMRAPSSRGGFCTLTAREAKLENLFLRKKAAETIQSAWRRYCCHRGSMALIRAEHNARHRAAVVFQRAWRNGRARRHFKEAVVVIQKNWRARSAYWIVEDMRVSRALAQHKALIKKHTASVTIQQAWRRRAQSPAGRSPHVFPNRVDRDFDRCAWRTKRKREGPHHRSNYGAGSARGPSDYNQAALTIQRYYQGYLARKWVGAYKERMLLNQASIEMDFTRTVRQWAIQMLAAKRIQAAVRGFLVRKKTKPIMKTVREFTSRRVAGRKILRAYRAMKLRQQCLREKGAMNILRRWELTFCSRAQFWRIRRAARTIQRRWIEVYDRRQWAATVLQTELLKYHHVRRRRNDIRQIVKIQAAWRGYCVRRASHPSLLAARARLIAKEEASREQPSQRIGFKCCEALRWLAEADHIEQVSSSARVIASATKYSMRCCEMVVFEDSGLSRVLNHLRRANRGRGHQVVTLSLLEIMDNIATKSGNLAGVICRQFGTLRVLSERMQFFRECPEVFHFIVDILAKICSAEDGLERVARLPNILNQWDSVRTLLARKLHTERNYIMRLEGEKGSDRSARSATQKVLITNRQLAALDALIAIVPDLHPREAAAKLRTAAAILSDAEKWRPKNMIVRMAATELSHNGTDSTESRRWGNARNRVDPSLFSRIEMGGAGSGGTSDVSSKRSLWR
ncbi:hypothetical protein BSKO_10177 [Bryopsis sp. KO-2023]|nr:hypothetical protein BSKO_10177 [Bryopsis sp. KO-2023]